MRKPQKSRRNFIVCLYGRWTDKKSDNDTVNESPDILPSSAALATQRSRNPGVAKEPYYVDSPLSDEIVRIYQIPDLETRFALLWNFLGVFIMSCADELHLVRHEDFAAQPEQRLADFYRSMG